MITLSYEIEIPAHLVEGDVNLIDIEIRNKIVEFGVKWPKQAIIAKE